VATTKNLSLKVGFQLQDYEILKVLSSGGFSFVYLARDKDNETVAIKEYLPASIALRVEGSTIEPTPDNVTLFKHGLKCFFDEALVLAKINHPNIVHVTNFFRENDTVYMVMKYELGKSLQEYILGQETPISEKFICRVFSELSNGLREVHAQKLLHMDIKPANIYIRMDGSPVLLDFGSARQILTLTQSKVTPSFTPGYASPEQYYDRTLLGPWSDIYSIGATMYSCLTKTAPLAADIRIKDDKLTPATKVGKDQYSDALLSLIDQCLSLDYLERPQSLLALQKLIQEVENTPKEKPGILKKIVGALNKPLSIR
jgi:serine/threonine protein kinase